MLRGEGVTPSYKGKSRVCTVAMPS